MDSVEIKDATARIYQELYRQATLRLDYCFKYGSKEEKWLADFATAMLAMYRKEEITAELLVQYFEFQFSRYSGVQTKYGQNSILVHWLIGKKALKAWSERDVNKNWKIKYRINKDFRLKLRKTFKDERKIEEVKQIKLIALETNPTEEETKRRFYNKPEGLVWCGTVNSLFTPASKLCLECNNQEACRKLLEREYPNTYKLRIEQ